MAASHRATDVAAYEAVLLGDPSRDYARMDAASQELYRDAVEEMATRSRCDPRVVATTAVRLAAERCAQTTPGDARRHVGYFLVAEGRDTLRASLTGAALPVMPSPRGTRATAWLGGTLVAVGTLLGVAALPYFHLDEFSRAIAVLLAALVLLHPVVRMTTFLSLVAGFRRPRRLPRLDFSAGIPSHCQTAVCVPTLVTDRRHVWSMLATLQRHAQVIADESVRIVLLTDWPDADRQEPTAEELALLYELVAMVERLNDEGGQARFYLLHRARSYSPIERCWMGWERKRGKLLQFNRLVADGTHEFACTVGDLTDLRRTVYAVAVDDDTVLAPGAIQALVGTIAHPVARLQRVAASGGTAIRGYGAIVPDVAPRENADGRDLGLPPRAWPRRVDFDVFGECLFPGQGLYDIRWAHQQLERRFPEGCVLSHDVVESGFLRCGFCERALFIDRAPQNLRLFFERGHRWMRGDWQNVWVLFRLQWRQLRDRDAHGEPLRLLQWFHVVMNVVLILPRLTLACLLAVVVCGDPAFADRRFAIVIALDLLPDGFAASLYLLAAAWRAGRRVPRLSDIAKELLKIPAILLVRIGSALHGGTMRADAMVSVLVRIVRRRHLLAWVSSGQLERRGMRFSRLDLYKFLAPITAILALAWMWLAARVSVSGLGVLLLTAVWPVVVWAWTRQRRRSAVVHSQ